MTNASVKPALTRIENKLDKIDKVVSELGNKTKTEIKNDENSCPIVEKLDCECENIVAVQQQDQGKRESLGESPQNEEDNDE